MKIPQMSSTLGIVGSRSRSWLDFEFFPIYHNTNCQLLYLSFETRKEVMIKYVCSSDIIVQHL